ncbi:glycerophosphodiester phosphodiesterase [Coxiella-like endosymbiont of Rhipicephalus sanguineus]|uniref:glycerophosphodiester phosphodiesterase n=1 Tax=Coxiella-like endosymbiont of Rhipicephalus sanguineus TaxID=1955402 RepID=UPI00203B3099|nr:glycerophosphodiester phosphodiesterase family protein [Coxiella-like endosymbiont of Rhipicephalus sanguineus]
MLQLNLPKIIAYWGVSLVASENTLSSLRAAKQLGAKLVEFDVRLTKDKQAIILHDLGWGREMAWI